VEEPAAPNGHAPATGPWPAPPAQEETSGDALTPEQREQIRQQVDGELAARVERYRLRTVAGTIDPEYLLLRDKRGRTARPGHGSRCSPTTPAAWSPGGWTAAPLQPASTARRPGRRQAAPDDR